MAEGVVEINDSSFDKEVLQSGVPVVVDFWARGAARVGHSPDG